MSTRSRQCVVCRKNEAISRKRYNVISSNECETKLRVGHRLYYKTDLPDQSLINSYVHKTCYVKVTRKLPSIKPRKQQMVEDYNDTTNTLDEIASGDSNFNVGDSPLNIEQEVNANVVLTRR